MTFILACFSPSTPVDVSPGAAHVAVAEVAASPASKPTIAWPGEGAPLTLLQTEFPADFGVKRITIDAGHGAEGNTGNVGAYGQREQDVALRTAEHLKGSLESTGHFDVRITRSGDERTAYDDRVRGANAWADAFVSIHTDIRAVEEASTWTVDGKQLRYLDGHAGFTVLWADNTGSQQLFDQRKRLARALSDSLREAGFTAYDGRGYDGKYADDPRHPGTMVDRHAPAQRIMMLRRTTVPGVIIETHHAWDREEAKRWEEEPTFEAFDAAVVRGLVKALE